MLLVIAQQLLKEKLWYVHATEFLKHVIPISTLWVYTYLSKLLLVDSLFKLKPASSMFLRMATVCIVFTFFIICL